MSELVAFILESEGYRMRTAADGCEGLEAVGRELPDLILLDIKMPQMDGRESARHFHAEYDGAVPIVVLMAAEDARRRAEEIGAQGWLGKPFSLEALVATVRHHIGR
ncbi:MAG: response regulator [Chloroflexi bacterium]|nr:response regulator [Chloroflexota bacterium]